MQICHSTKIIAKCTSVLGRAFCNYLASIPTYLLHNSWIPSVPMWVDGGKEQHMPLVNQV